ncbi:hypothetical protein BO78DRAFT_401495 [Aspergillus sclerotiicarbonarius CBS 121057]|uniref:Uncharacterized protein n=1 Tax=Aspergillus sclerotiicarbonarius (strain CBS 121057 / IBT 28362) TaxID=1448318 RepID=A0A319E3R0_ASPSB|nr:hypothetical protein BO78DRAFT_401495 [Aspergillus sclerotiicarbonarius CBS 121057]
MKLFNLLLLWCSVLFTNVLADNESVGYEMIYFYYVYKMEFEADVANTIATGCTDKYNRMCVWSEFAKYIMEDEWSKVYKPATGDNTKTPGTNQLKALVGSMPASASYYTSRLFSDITTLESFPQIFDRALDASNVALRAGGVTTDTIKSALDMVKSVKTFRNRAVLSLELQALEAVLPEAAREYITSTSNVVDYDATLEAFDGAEYDGDITEEQAEEWKQAVEDFSEDIIGTLEARTDLEQSDRTHISILRGVTTCVNELSTFYDSSSSGDSSPRAPSCDDADIEFSFGSSSASDSG